MPGTVATAVVGIPSVYILSFANLTVARLVLVFSFYIACAASFQAAKELREKDPPAIVIDELFGFWVTMAGFPVTWISVLVGFVCFRIFDIWKPWPIWVFDRDLEGGLGIVMDDLAAGIYAHALLWIVLWASS